MSWNLCGNQSQSRKTRIVIPELLEVQGEQVWELETPRVGEQSQGSLHLYLCFISRRLTVAIKEKSFELFGG